MPVINVNVNEALWATSILPEGTVVRWFVKDGGTAQCGHRVAEVRIEGALHDIVAPATGRLKICAKALDVIEPGRLLATVDIPESQS